MECVNKIVMHSPILLDHHCAEGPQVDEWKFSPKWISANNFIAVRTFLWNASEGIVILPTLQTQHKFRSHTMKTVPAVAA